MKNNIQQDCNIHDILKKRYISSILDLLKIDTSDERDILFKKDEKSGVVKCGNTRLFSNISISEDYILYFQFKSSGQLFMKDFDSDSYSNSVSLASSYISYLTDCIEERINNGLSVMTARTNND